MEESLMAPGAQGSADSICRERDGMEDSLTAIIDTAFSLPRKDWMQYSPLTLAYIGDCVYDLVVRTVLVKRTNKPTDVLHRETAGVVKAVSQSRAARSLLDTFTPEEMAVYRRGKNAKPHTTAKHATRKEYLQATGLEAVLGYLYLSGRHERLVELIRTAAGEAL